MRRKFYSALTKIIIMFTSKHFCAWHESCAAAAVAWAKFQSDEIAINEITVKQDAYQMWITMENH